MPLPAARVTHPHVGAAGGQGSRVTARSDAQVRRLLWCGEPAYGEIHPANMCVVQCGHLRDIPQDRTAASLARHAHAAHRGQRAVSPCPSTRTTLTQIPARPGAPVSPAIQPPAGSNRAGVEVGPAFGDTQSLLRHARRIAHRHSGLLRSVANPQFRAAKIMRHYLRRYV